MFEQRGNRKHSVEMDQHFHQHGGNVRRRPNMRKENGGDEAKPKQGETQHKREGITKARRRTGTKAAERGGTNSNKKSKGPGDKGISVDPINRS